MKFKRIFLTMTAAAILTACGGGGNDNTPPTTTMVLNFAAVTNLDSTGWPWFGAFGGVVKAWTLPIPVKINGEARANPAMDAIESKLGIVVFDRTSLTNIADAAVTRGIVFSKGTSYLPIGANPQSYCANVSVAPNNGDWPQNFLKNQGEISTRVYVNLDNPSCTASSEVAIHELGHALGMLAHFQGFGDGPSISSAFWSVLATLYSNPIGTPKANVVVKLVN
jgi:hypothetical protein